MEQPRQQFIAIGDNYYLLIEFLRVLC